MTEGGPNNSAAPLGPQVGQSAARKPRAWRWPKRLAIFVVVIALGWGCYSWWQRREPQPSTAIFTGVTYGCDRLPATAEGSGLVHWVRIDLTAPGIELYVTPLDPSAVKEGWQYRLRRTEDVLESEHLDIVINGSLFTSDSGWLRLSGDLAKGVETVVADHVVSHFWEHTYLLWFDDHLMPHLKPSKPPTEAELAAARWGIGGQGVGLQNGEVWPDAGREPNARTAVAIDQQRRLLFLAVAENCSPHRLLGHLASLGAKDGMLVDGGGSSSMAISDRAKNIRTGTMYGGQRPVATHFGVRARPLRTE
jgi:hypothetical protein